MEWADFVSASVPAIAIAYTVNGFISRASELTLAALDRADTYT